MKSQPKVILAGCRHGGLAIARALGNRGFDVVALVHDRSTFADRSRYVTETSACPDPTDVDAFAAHLLDNVDRWGGALVLDTDDAFTAAIARRRDELAESYHVVTPPWEVARWFLEKDRTAELARTVGVPHPAVHRPRSGTDLDAVVDGLSFPAMIKPVRSHEFTAAFGTKLWVFDDPKSLIDGFARTTDAGIETIVQEVVPGPDTGTLVSIEVYINSDGSLGAHQCNVKERQSPPMFGVMRVGRSVPVIDDVRDHTLSLLRHVHYRGYASAEFKRDPRDGEPKLIEVNARLPRNLALLTRSGTNFPLEIHRDLVDGIRSVPGPVSESWFIDVTADVVETLGRDRQTLRRPRALVRPYLARRRSFAVLSARDPKPVLRWGQLKARKLVRRK